MRTGRHISFMLGCLMLGGLLSACSPGSSLTSPSPGSATNNPAGATIAGTLASGAAGAALSGGPARSLTGPLTLLQVTIVGTDLSAAVDESGHFLLVDVPPGTIQLLFTGPGVHATTTVQNVGPQDYIELRVALDGANNATILAQEHSAASLPICHLTGTGRFRLIQINPSAEAGHRAHGDGLPGEVVPNAIPEATFGPNCEAPLVEREDEEDLEEEEDDEIEEEEQEEDDEDSSVKVSLCHRTGSGRFVFISVDIDAQPAHMAHGDGLPGGPVPDGEGLTFGPACEVPTQGSPASN